MTDNFSAIRNEIKNNKQHIEKKDVKQRIIKEVVPTSLEAQKRAENARKDAHNLTAEIKRNVSMEIKNKLSESFDFIEESCGSGSPEFEFFKEPTMVSEGLADGCSQYPIIGRASGVFAPIGVMSRNNRIYDNDHYDYLLDNQHLVDRITHRGMLGTIGHHDKKVDDQDLADGKVSHIVTNLRIVEEADGSRNLYGTLEILDTPAGHLLKTYYDSGVPLFVSSRGGGNLLPVPNESYKRVDKTKYFLETFDIVKNPGFLQAKPVYERVSEGVEEVNAIAETQTEEIVESVEESQPDKIDILIEAFTKLADTFVKAQEKKEEKEDNEKKEAQEKKEAKEKAEAKEATEAQVNEAKKEKEDEDKAEDEKKDDEESAVASSVTEEEEQLKKGVQKIVDKILDPHKGLNKKAIEKGYVQTNFIPKENAVQMAKDCVKANNERRKFANDLKKQAKERMANQAKEEKKNEIATQLKLGLQESNRARKQGVGVKGQDIVDGMGTKYFKDGAQMHPNSLGHSNGDSGRYLGTNGGRDYADYDKKKELQQKIKDGGLQYHKNQARELSNRDANKPIPRGPENKDYRNGQHDNVGTNASFRAQDKLARAKKAMNEAQEAESKVQCVGEVSKNAGKLDKHIEEPQTMDRQELARTLKANTKKENK